MVNTVIYSIYLKENYVWEMHNIHYKLCPYAPSWKMSITDSKNKKYMVGGRGGGEQLWDVLCFID